MMRDTVRGQRRSIRLDGYDYASAGAYFVTICTQDRACVFGDVVDGEMRSNPAGQMVQDVWDGLPTHYPGVNVDAFVLMPNHVHGVVLLTDDDSVGAGPRACPRGGRVVDGVRPRDDGQPQGVAPTGTRRLSLPDVVHRFKSLTTARYRDGVVHHAWPAFRGRLWQRNYYEQIIRDEDSLNRVRAYVSANPARWLTDRDNQNPIHGIERRTT
jgi:REP element-mobilizing transposase RayT